MQTKRATSRAYQYAEGAFALDATPAASVCPRFDDASFSITIPFAASLGRDRQGDFLEVGGIDVTNHRRLPVAYLDHGVKYVLPIGRCTDDKGEYHVTIDVEAGMAWATIFLSRSHGLLTEQVYSLYRDGVLRAGSIGYRPTKVQQLPADPASGILKKGLRIDQCELLEVSVVGLPANADCVAQALAGKVAGKSLMAPIREAILPYAPAIKAWSRGVELPVYDDFETQNYGDRYRFTKLRGGV